MQPQITGHADQQDQIQYLAPLLPLVAAVVEHILVPNKVAVMVGLVAGHQLTIQAAPRQVLVLATPHLPVQHKDQMEAREMLV